MQHRGWPDLRSRSEAPELMDDPSIGGDELVEALRQLRWINRLLGAALPTLEGVARLWREAGCPRRLTLLDVGAGSGDINRLLLRWADWRRVEVDIILVDVHADTCKAAAAFYRNEPRIQVVQGDVFALPSSSVDIVTAALFVHHFSYQQAPDILRAMARAARLGVVVNDLHRHHLAWASIWVLTRIFSRNRMIRHDAPQSVCRGFQAADFEQMRALPGLAGLCYRWRPLFRYLVTLRGHLTDESEQQHA